MELYLKHRPTTFKGLVGQVDAVRILNSFVKNGEVPHAILLTGPSGCGKTTVARILRTKLECHESDFRELNCADFRGIDMIRDIRQRMNLAPAMGGACRIYLIDEAHKLTNDAQTAFLKMLEDTPGHVYFMLATTHHQKLIPTIRTRCTPIKVRLLTAKEIMGLLQGVAAKEKKQLAEEVAEKIVNCSEGSARKALVILNQVIDLEDEESQLAAVSSADTERQSIDIARALFNPRTNWAAMSKVIKEVEDDEEGIRRMVLGYAANVLLGGGKLSGRAFLVLDAFRNHWFDCGKAGLVAACYEVIGSKGK